MSRTWSARSEEERKRAEAAFVARHGAELLLDGDAEPPPATGVESLPATQPAHRGLPFARLHASLHGGGPLPPEVSAALRSDPDLRDDFALLVRRSARQHLPRAAAAAGREGLLRREAGGFVVRLVASRAGRDQVYLLVELPEEAAGGANMAAEPDATAAKWEPDEGRAGADRFGGEHAPGSAGGTQAGAAPPRAAPSAPDRIVVRTAEGDFLKQVLPSPEDRTVRLVMAADDPLVRAVAEPTSEIYLL